MMLLCLVLLAVLPAEKSDAVVLKCGDTLEKEPAKVLKAYCPDCTSADNRVWGSQKFTIDSSVCRACQHAGVIDKSGGYVLVTRTGPMDKFTGTARNQIESLDYDKTSESFECQPFEEKIRMFFLAADCSTTADNIAYTIYKISCPPGCAETSYEVWGTVDYATDSSLCRAAIHSGVIPNEGGQVIIKKSPGQSEYFGSKQNGVETLYHEAWPLTFQCLKPTPPKEPAAAP